MKPSATSKPEATDQTDWQRVDATTDEEIDLSDDPEWTAADFAEAKRHDPGRVPTKQPVSIRLSPEVLAYFKGTGKGWQTRMDQVLKEYVATHR